MRTDRGSHARTASTAALRSEINAALIALPALGRARMIRAMLPRCSKRTRGMLRVRPGDTLYRLRGFSVIPSSMPAGLAACSSYDPGSPVSPIAVAQHTLVELAGREAREFSLEIDRARTLLVRQMRSAEVHQLIHQIGVGLNVGHDLDHSLYFFAKILIRNAEYCCIRDLGMSDEQVLALLWIDVDPAADDHEGGTIGQIEKSVVVDIAHIADRAHGAVLRSRLPGLRRFVEVFERRRGLEPKRARRFLRAGLHVVVQHVQFAEQNLADGTTMSQPLLAVAGCESETLGRTVILMNDRSPPREHLLLHLDRTRRGGVDYHLERRQIVARPRGLGQFQHAREHRRHELAVGRLIPLDQLQIVLRIEPLHDDCGTAVADHEVDGRLRCRMVKRGGGQIHEPLPVAPQLLKKIKQWQLLRRWLVGQWAENTFWPAGCPRRVRHGRANGLVCNRRGGEAGGGLVEIEDTVAVARAVHHQHGFDLRALADCCEGGRASLFGYN